MAEPRPRQAEGWDRFYGGLLKTRRRGAYDLAVLERLRRVRVTWRQPDTALSGQGRENPMSRSSSGLVSARDAALLLLMLCAAAASAAAAPVPSAPSGPAAAPLSSPPPSPPAPPSASAPSVGNGDSGLAGLSFLLGEWEGRGGGGPGQGSGWFSFIPDLQQKVMVRRNHSDYPAAEGRPAYSHDDLMVVYPQAAGRPPQAIYFDSEGHVIRYQVRLEPAEPAGSPNRPAAVFLSDAAPPAPRFRLTYQVTGPDTLDLTFEIAPPDKPDAFARYITASARRRAATAKP